MTDTAGATIGLTSAEVAERVTDGRTNAYTDATSRSAWSIIRSNVFTLFNGIIVACFAVLLALVALTLPETNREGAAIVAERIRAVVAGTPVPIPAGGQIEVTLSIGVATFPMAGDSASVLFASADQALYAAKQAGRNTFRSAP